MTLQDQAATAPAVGRRASLPGAVAGAVLRAARLSANLTVAGLAGATLVSPRRICRWERGDLPLGAESPATLTGLAAALLAAQADPMIVADLETAIWCDLIISGLTEGWLSHLDEPADALVLELLAWAASGMAPARYIPYTEPAPLLPASDAQLITAAGRLLATGEHPGTRRYGTAVTLAVCRARAGP
jgi:transcriptional regulator with XRE-family HTH domain